MTDVISVAAYILSRTGAVEALKLQKLAYYCQAWYLAWTGGPLFPENFQAWANGPVCRELYDAHYRQYWILPGKLTERPLSEAQRTAINRVLDFYGAMTPQQLSDLTHSEEPWVAARRLNGASDGDRSEAVIDNNVMMNYYRRQAARAAAMVRA
jgi:uncharacterized phage-associated protein